MKAERRHELQTNSLAAALQNFPQLLQQYGARILLGITLVVLLIVLLQYRARTVEQHELVLQQHLSGARASINEIRQPDPRLPVDRILATRQQLTADTEAAINDVLENSDAAEMRAEALLARGDLYWALATAPVFPTTQPAATQPAGPAQRTPDDLYRSAQAAYEQVLRDYPDATRTGIAALFGLAAVAENQQNWDLAAQRYKEVAQATDLGMYQQLAEARLRILDRLREPLYIGQPTPLPTFETGDAPLPEGVAAPPAAPTEPAATEPPTEPAPAQVPPTEAPAPSPAPGPEPAQTPEQPTPEQPTPEHPTPPAAEPEPAPAPQAPADAPPTP
jgi:hypothetical protein